MCNPFWGSESKYIEYQAWYNLLWMNKNCKLIDGGSMVFYDIEYTFYK
jgi:hypothetical protein